MAGQRLLERYVAWAGWTHLVVIVLACTLLPGWIGRSVARVVAAAALALGLTHLVDGRGTRNTVTQDWTPVVREIEARRAPGDAYFVQDMDLWSGPGSFDRLWFERYDRGALPIVHGGWIGRFDLYRQGPRLDDLGPEVQRVWVLSSLFGSRWLSRMPRTNATAWKLVGRVFEQSYALGLFARADPAAAPNADPR